jgi:hypothetical protein
MSDKEIKIKQYGLTVDFSSDVDYHLRDDFAKAIEKQISDGIADAADKFALGLFLHGSNPAENTLIKSSPLKKAPYDEKLLPTQDGWCVGYIREWNCVDIYHKHGFWPFTRKWHFAEKGTCPECQAELPSEMWTAINLLIDL